MSDHVHHAADGSCIEAACDAVMTQSCVPRQAHHGDCARLTVEISDNVNKTPLHAYQHHVGSDTVTLSSPTTH